VIIEQTKQELRFGYILLGGAAHPSNGPRLVLRNTLARVIQNAELVLRLRVALLGGLLIPTEGLSSLAALRVGARDKELRLGIAGGGLGEERWIDLRGLRSNAEHQDNTGTGGENAFESHGHAAPHNELHTIAKKTPTPT